MNPIVVFYEVLILFIIMLAGFIAVKTRILGEDGRKQLSSFIINITLPVVILMSSQMEFTQEKITNSIWLLGMSVIMFVISILISAILYKKSGSDKEKVLKFATVFSNSAYMGFPVLYALLGSEGIFYGSVFLLPFNVFLWTYGVLIFKKHTGLKQSLKEILSPSMISIIVTFIFLGFKVRIPYPVNDGLNIIGGLTTPLSMIVIGGTLATVQFRTLISDKWIYIVSAIRLLILPALAYGLFFWLSPPQMSLTILVLIIGMPCAAATTIFAQQYGGNTKLASGVVSFSTLISIGTIPFIIYLFL